jgi:hypothetical protein
LFPFLCLSFIFRFNSQKGKSRKTSFCLDCKECKRPKTRLKRRQQTFSKIFVSDILFRTNLHLVYEQVIQVNLIWDEKLAAIKQHVKTSQCRLNLQKKTFSDIFYSILLFNVPKLLFRSNGSILYTKAIMCECLD